MIGRNPTRGAGERRVWRKRRRYMFRKQSSRGRILLMVVVGASVLTGLIWLAPGLALFSGDVDAPKVEDPKGQTEQAPAEDQQPEQASANDQPEQEAIRDQPEDENAPKDTPPPPKGEGASNNPPAPSPPPVAQPPPSPAPLSPPPGVEEVPKGYLYSNDYWDYYYEPSYYWDYYYEPSYYYWDYWDY